jgi:Protein of unknown function (DUF3987)/Toprim domain
MNELPNANKFVPFTEAELAAVTTIGGSIQNDIVRIAKAREIFAGAVPIAGTPAAIYLQSRGIDPANPPKGIVGWHKRSSAIVFVARDDAGSISACQRVFLTSEGKKAQVDPVKRTNGVLRGAAMSLPGDGETLACEGPEDALTLWQATNRPVMCVFGLSGLATIPLEAGQPVTVCADNDGPGAPATTALNNAVAALLAQGHRVKVAFPFGVKDANALLISNGLDAVRSMVNAATVANVATVASALIEPLPLFPPLSEPEPYPVDALGATISQAAKAIASKAQVPTAMAAQSVLAAASLAACAHADVMMPYGQGRPLSLFFATVAASGDRKSTADNEALWPIHKREKDLREANAEDVKKWKIEHAAWIAEKRNIEAEKKSSTADRKSRLELLGEEPERPLAPFLVTGDLTIEGLTKNWPIAHAALGVFTAEGGTFTAGHSMNDDNRLKTAAMLSELWDGKPIKRVRALDGVTILPGRRLALHVMIQPDAAAGFLCNDTLRDQGLLSRVLIAAPSSMAGTRLYKENDPNDVAAIKAYGARLLSILEADLPLEPGKRNELTPRALPISAGATAPWRTFYNHIEIQCGVGNPLASISDFAAKAAEHAARIAGVITIIEDLHAKEIGEKTMCGAIALVDWYVNEACRLQQAGRTDPGLRRAATLLEWLQAQPKSEICFREILRLGPNPTRTKDAAEEALLVLTSHGWISEILKRPRVIRVVCGDAGQ